jgi:predicted O-methyltransferase YrrM
MELFYEPRKEALNKITNVDVKTEMSAFESAFVCGLIKENRPRKILEVGVAAGGTTSIILQCNEDLGLGEECEVFSVDLNELYYRGAVKRQASLQQN